MTPLLRAVAGLALLSLLLSGCQATPKRVAYTSLNSVAIAVDAARGSYVEAYRAGKVDTVTHAKVIALDNNFAKAMNIAITAAQMDWGAPPTAEVCALATELVTLIGGLTK